MMTMEEELKMFKGKKVFIDNISKAFEVNPKISSVNSIEYEVYHKDIIVNDEHRDYFEEYVVVNFFGGGKSVKLVSGNSCTANFRALGSMLDGGYYKEMEDYETLKDRGFSLVQLSANMKLDKLLSKPMKHIRDIEACFDYCRNSSDVERVIRMIPSAFGTFEADYDEDDQDEFYICNTYYDETDSEQSETYTFEFYKGEV